MQRNNYNFVKEYVYRITNQLDIIIGIVGCFLGFVIIYLSYFAGLHQEDIGFVVLIACIIYLVLRKTLIESPIDFSVKQTKTTLLLLHIIFVAAFTASVLLLRLNLYHRPLVYFILVSVACAALAVEILCLNTNKKTQIWSIIFKIIILSISFRAGIFYEFPTLMGADAWFHADFGNFISSYGSIPPIEVFHSGKYVAFPIFHIAVASTKIITSMDLKDSLFFSIILFSVISTIFIYLIGKSIAGPKFGLLAMLFANVSDMFIIRGVTNFTTGSLVLCYFLIILYLILKDSKKLENTGLMLFLIFLLILTHQLTTFASFMLLIGIFIGKQLYERLYKYKKDYTVKVNLSLTSILFFTITLLTYWMHTASSSSGTTFFDALAHTVVDVLISSEPFFNPTSSPYVGYYGQYSVLSNVLYHFGYLILFFFAIIGVLFWLSAKNINIKKVSMIIALVVIYLFIYGIPLSGFKDAMLSHRWLPFAYIFLVLAASQSVFSIIGLSRKSKTKIVAVSCITLLFTFFMITTPYINQDSPIYDKDRTSRSMYKYSEIAGASTISKIYDGNLTIDTSMVFYGVPFNGSFKRMMIDTEKMDKGMIVLRKCNLVEPTQVTKRGSFAVYRSVVLGEEFFKKFETVGYNKVYDNGEVMTYTVNSQEKEVIHS
jgi:hypothetical protein